MLFTAAMFDWEEELICGSRKTVRRPVGGGDEKDASSVLAG